MWDIVFSKNAEREFKKLDNRLKTRISYALWRAKNNPFKYFLKLANYDIFRIRVGDYRVLAKFIYQKKRYWYSK